MKYKSEEKDVSVIEKNIELALYVIELKKAQMIKNNNEASYTGFKEKMEILLEEKKEIYNGNEEVINKVLTEYLNEVKK